MDEGRKTVAGLRPALSAFAASHPSPSFRRRPESSSEAWDCRDSRHALVRFAKTANSGYWIPACAGMTVREY
jgi:hypothetical protein